MIDLSQEIPNENLTQKDIMQFLLHFTQHVATREELQDISKLDVKVDKINFKFDKLQWLEILKRVKFLQKRILEV